MLEAETGCKMTSHIDHFIECHRGAVERLEAVGSDPRSGSVEIDEAFRAAETEKLALLSSRPTSLNEVHQKAAYLRRTVFADLAIGKSNAEQGQDETLLFVESLMGA